jgi:hypothetical protein
VGVTDQQPVTEDIHGGAGDGGDTDRGDGDGDRGDGDRGDGGGESRAVAEERARELAALNQVKGDLAAVDRTLAALDDGTYGTCEVCGVAIADDVLEASPVARSCGAHDEAHDAAAAAGA